MSGLLDESLFTALWFLDLLLEWAPPPVEDLHTKSVGEQLFI